MFHNSPRTAVRLGPMAGCNFMRAFADDPTFREDKYEGPAARHLADKYCRCSAALAKYDPPIRGFWRTYDVDAVADSFVWKMLVSSYGLVGPVGTRVGQRLGAWVKDSADLPTLRRIGEADIDPEGRRESSCIDYQPYWSANGGNTAFDGMGIALLARNQIQQVETRLQEEQEAARQREEMRLREEQEAARWHEEVARQAAEEQRRAADEVNAKRPRILKLLADARARAGKNDPRSAEEKLTEALDQGARSDPKLGDAIASVEAAIANTPARRKELARQEREAADAKYQHARELVEHELAAMVGKEPSTQRDAAASIYLEGQITNHGVFVTSEHSYAFQMSLQRADRALHEMVTMRNLPSSKLAAAKEELARSGAFLAQATRTEASARSILETCVETWKAKVRYQSAERGSPGDAIYQRLAKASDECVKPMTEAAIQLRRNILASFEIKTAIVDLLGWK
jgi:hypothetical protein